MLSICGHFALNDESTFKKFVMLSWDPSNQVLLFQNDVYQLYLKDHFQVMLYAQLGSEMLSK